LPCEGRESGCIACIPLSIPPFTVSFVGDLGMLVVTHLASVHERHTGNLCSLHPGLDGDSIHRWFANAFGTRALKSQVATNKNFSASLM
jgi:hypothetical protein